MWGIFTRAERVVLLFLAAAIAVGSLVVGAGRIDPSRAPESASSGEAGSEAAPPALIDVNAADEIDLELLPGIGPVRAREIVRLREERGGFRSLAELADVRGIGPVTLERLAACATVGESAAARAAPPTEGADRD
jgi:competence protein ComEA